MARRSPPDSMATVVAIMDRMEGLTPSVQEPEVKDPGDVCRRVGQVYQDQGLPCDPGVLARALEKRGEVEAEGADDFSFGTAPNLMELGLVGMIVLSLIALAMMLLGPVKAHLQARSTAALLIATMAQSAPQAKTTWASSDAQSLIQAVKGQVMVAEDAAQHPVITVTASHNDSLVLASALMTAWDHPHPPRLELWANGHRIVQPEDMARTFACPSRAACAAPPAMALVLRVTPDP